MPDKNERQNGAQNLLIVGGLVLFALLALAAAALASRPNEVVYYPYAFQLVDENQGNDQAAAPTTVPTESVQPTVQPTTAPVQEAAAPVECPQARGLGPWAPSASGVGETFEVTASDHPDSLSAGVVLGLWWPNGNTPWGKQEVTTFIPTGLSVDVINGGGRGWDYEGVCTWDEIRTQMNQHIIDRAADTDYHGYVAIDELIKMGLVKVRFDHR